MSAPISFRRPDRRTDDGDERGGGAAGAAGSFTGTPSSGPLSRVLAEEPGEMAFSPSNMTPRTLDNFHKEEAAGVPLQTAWTFWLDRTSRNATAAEYKANLRKIYSVSTVQGFWSVYNHIPDVSEISVRYYYHLMREERPPLWEDPALASGGVWRLKCSKKETPRVWRELLLAAIGEQFTSCVTPGDDVCGLSVSPRERDDLVQIWNLDAEAATRAGDNSPVLRKVHQLMPEVRFMAEFYKPHQTHSAFEGSKRKY